MKMLQPVPPGPNSKQSAILAYKAAQSKWDRDPLQYACKAYCTARQELNILLTLKHPKYRAVDRYRHQPTRTCTRSGT